MNNTITFSELNVLNVLNVMKEYYNDYNRFIYTILFNISFIFIVEPLGEWCFHTILHIINNKNHNNHHYQYLIENRVNIERWPFFLILISIYYNYNYIALAFLKYWLVHTIIHLYPRWIPTLTKHHILNHIKKKYNFCVSAIWPDKLFGTYLND